MRGLLSRNEIIGFVFGILLIVVMGIITFTGPYHMVSKPVAAAAYPTVTVKMLTDPKTIGRFSPETVAVHVGQKVTWVNDSNDAHTVDARNGPFHSGNMDVGASWSYIPTKPGKYPYVCIYHPFMVGTLIVVKAGAKLPSVAAQPTPASAPKQKTASGPFTTVKNANKWLAIDTKAHRVVITEIAAYANTNNGFNFDGYSDGKADFVVPQGWTVEFKFSNNASIPHSLAIALSHGSNPKLAKFAGQTATTLNALAGITKGKTQTVTFSADSTGHYFLICEVPGHDIAGMWDYFTVSKQVTKPILQVR